MTAVAVLKLVDDGLLDLDEDVNHYLKSWKVPPNGCWQPRITLRQLLSHSAGATVDGSPGYRRGRPVPATQEVLDGRGPANTPPVRINLLPGVQQRYSNGGITIVQLLLADITGMPFPRLMREMVLDPIEMKRSTFEQPLPRVLWPIAASGHRGQDGVLAGRWHVYPEMAAVGLWTTPSDLLRFAAAVQMSVAGTPGSILRANTANQMLTRQAGGSMGLGFMIDGSGSSTRFGHTGRSHSFRSTLQVQAFHGGGVAVMINSDARWDVCQEVVASVMREYAWPAETTSHRPSPNACPAAGPLDRFAGEYRSASGLAFRVVAGDGQLSVSAAGQAAIPFWPVSGARFQAHVINAVVDFVDDAGVVTGLRLVQEGKETPAAKV